MSNVYKKCNVLDIAACFPHPPLRGPPSPEGKVLLLPLGEAGIQIGYSEPIWMTDEGLQAAENLPRSEKRYYVQRLQKM